MENSATGGTIVLDNCTLIDAQHPEPRPGMQIVIESGLIKEVTSEPVKSAGARRIDVGGRSVLPGLIDCHNHICLSEVSTRRLDAVPLTLMTARAVPVLKATLDRGFTTLRDAGGADWGIRTAIEDGLIPGPRLFIAGQALSQTGGHGDFRHRTEKALTCPCESAMRFTKYIADGVPEVQRATRELLRQGADQIKVMVSGGVASLNDPIDATQYSADELRAIVAEAGAWKTYVMAHAYTPEAITHAIRSGVRTIEHANLVDAAAARLIHDNDAFAVPTLVTYDRLAAHGKDYGFPEVSMRKLARVLEAGLQAMDILKQAGVKIGFGTDLLGDLRRYQSREFVIRAEVLTPYEIICQATRVNAEILNRTNQLGVIAAGATADLIVVDGDPLRDISLLDGQGEHIPLVMKDGVVHKQWLQ
ncbi:MAG: amidohydrolase family protein [Candidimonas sp.]|jgi:imidazolonepropionase-like amidohydrolase